MQQPGDALTQWDTGKNKSIIGLVQTTKINSGCQNNFIWAVFHSLGLSVANKVYDSPSE